MSTNSNPVVHVGGHRSFGGLDDHLVGTTDAVNSTEVNAKIDSKEFLEALNSDIIGNYSAFSSPFGKRPLIYCDWTASGRAVGRIENYIQNSVLPVFGNTHTSTSITGLQSTCFRQESRQIIAQAVNARITGKASPDAVIFTGNGVTASIHKLITSLGLHVPLPSSAFTSERQCDIPVVFTSAYEHHSNLLSWRETAADVITIAYHPITGVCLADLHRQLLKFSCRKCKIGSFSACSNVTGIMTPTEAVSVIMHRHGGLAVFDYASAAPYVKMDMNPVDMSGSIALYHALYGSRGDGHEHGEDSFGLPAFTLNDRQHAHKDGIMFSGHKFLGGPGSPGVLIVKKNLLMPISEAPTVPGGGSVFYVTETHQRYLSNREEREEAGTPNVLGDIRIGLVIHLKQLVNSALKNDPNATVTWLGDGSSADTGTTYTSPSGQPVTVEDIEVSLAGRLQQRLEALPNVVLLGRFPGGTPPNRHNSSLKPRHLPIFSLLVRYPNSNKFYHYNFICALLNDLFGIQARGGCQCAGPFSQQLLGITGVTGGSKITGVGATGSHCIDHVHTDALTGNNTGKDINSRYEVALLEKHEVLRPGYARLAFPFWMTHQDIDYVINAIEFVSNHAWKFLSQYKCNLKTGEWAHYSRFSKFPNRLWLTNSMNLSTYSATSATSVAPAAADHTTSSICMSNSRSFNAQYKTLMEDLDGNNNASKTKSRGKAVTGNNSEEELEKREALESDNEKRASLFAAVRAQVEAECHKLEQEIQTRFNKTKGKNSSKGASASALKVDMQDFNGLRWFILQDETEVTNDLITPGETVPGGENVIKPEGWVDTWNHSLEEGIAGAVTNDDDAAADSSSDGTDCAGVNNVDIIEDTMYDTSKTGISNSKRTDHASSANPYGNHRATKMSVHDRYSSARDAQRLPRYMRSASDGGVLPGQYLTATVPPLGGHIVSVHQEIAALPAPSVTSSSSESSGSNDVSENMLTDDSVTCVDGTCFLRSRATDAPVTAAAPMAIDDNAGVSSATAAAVTADGHIPYVTPPKKIMKLVGQAVKDWNMFEEGDRVLLGLSGGKDSLSMLHILLALQKRSPVKFSISCCTIDPQTESFDPRAIIPYMEALGKTPNKLNASLHRQGHEELVQNTNIPYHFISEPIIELAKTKLQGDSLCAFCARFKRGLLYKCCRDHKYNKLVLAQHLDDLAESFLMSTLHNGQLRTMKANYPIDSGCDIRVVRPFIYVREQSTKEFSMIANLPVINENCPACFEQPKERDRVKRLLAQEEVMVPALFSNLKHTLLPLMDSDIYEAMGNVANRIASNNSRFHIGPNTKTESGSLLDVPVTVDNNSDKEKTSKEETEETKPSKRMKTSA